MKRIFSVFIILVSTSVVGHAQFFIEGNLGVSSNFNKGTTGDNEESRSALIFGASPKVGYWLNDRMAVGVSVSYNRYNQTDRYMNLEQEKQWHKLFQSQYGFSVFGRYQLFCIKKLNVLAESSLGITRSVVKAKQTSIAVYGSSSSTLLDISVYPVISYDLTDNFSILTICDFARLGFNTGVSKHESTGIKNTGSNFSFNANSNILNSLANARVGFTYKFKQ